MVRPKSFRTRVLTVSAAAAGLVALASMAPAQGAMGFVAPSEAMDTLSGQSTGPSPFIGVDRARNAAGMANARDPFAPADPFAAPAANPWGQPAPGAAAANPWGMDDPTMMGGPATGFGDPFAGAGFAPGGAFGAQPQPTFQIPKLIAIYGERVVCARTGTILRDADEVPIWQTFMDDYYDDGKSGMDYRANDKVYTLATLRNDVVSPEVNVIRTRSIQALRVLENLSPSDFFGIPVASTDPLANVPQVLDLEERRDDYLQQWAERMLSDFLADPDSISRGEWTFVPTFLPPPPFPPLVQVPANFYPHFDPEPRPGEQPPPEQQQQQGDGGLGNLMGTNNIQQNPGASSAYMGGGGGREGF